MIRRGFTLVELILAIFILGIGMISVAALFPVGIAQQQASEDDVYGPVVARQAIETIRSKVRSSDFGSFEEFSEPGGTLVRDPVPLQRTSPNPSASQTGVPEPTTVSGDWSWKRPGMLLDDIESTAAVDEAGMVDVFSLLFTRSKTSRPTVTGQTPVSGLNLNRVLTEFPSGIPYAGSSSDALYGIPYNRSFYDQNRDVRRNNYEWRLSTGAASAARPPETDNDPADARNVLREPGVFITQRERYWPVPAQTRGTIALPKYVWECMFRRYCGRVQVAIFVYRLAAAGGIRGGNPATGTPYVVADASQMLIDEGVEAARVRGRPALPQWACSRDGSPGNLRRNDGVSRGKAWGAGGLDARFGVSSDMSKYGVGLDDRSVPGTEPVTGGDEGLSARALDYSDGWQAPGAWFVDFFGNVHRVVSGRRLRSDGPVTLAQGVPRQSYGNALIDRWSRSQPGGPDSRNFPTSEGALIATPFSGNDAVTGIQDVWFIPLFDANGNQLVPVYAAVENLDP